MKAGVEIGRRVPPVHTFFLVSAATALSAAAATFIPEAAGMLELQLDRPYRLCGLTLLTAHFTHWSFDHFFWDAITLVTLLFCYESQLFRRSAAERRSLELFTVLPLSAVFISLSIIAAGVSVTTYRGLSGLCMTACVLLMSDLRTKNGRFSHLSLIALALLIGKLAFECWSGLAIFVDTGKGAYTLVPEAHMAGVLAGMAAVYAKRLQKRLKWCSESFRCS